MHKLIALITRQPTTRPIASQIARISGERSVDDTAAWLNAR